jgi:sulfonate transport system substrate-binding protein
MIMTWRSAIALGVAAVSVVGLTACGAGASASSPSTVPVPGPVSAAQLKSVTLRVGDQKGAGIQVLLQAAGLADTPYKIQWSTFTSGPPMLEAANDNAVDVGQVGNTPPIFAAAAGGGIDVVGALRSTVGDSLLVPRNSAIHTLADLRGRTIAVAKGSSANGTLLNALAKAGLTPGDVKISYLQPADAYAGFSQGSVDAWAVWDPYVTEAVENLGARELVSGADALRGTGPAAGAALSNGYSFQVASRSALADPGRNTALADYLARVAKAQLWAAGHLDAWAAVYARQTGIPLATVRAAIGRIVLTPVPLSDSVVAAEQKLADAFSNAGQLPGKVDFAAFVDRRFAAALAPLTSAK